MKKKKFLSGYFVLKIFIRRWKDMRTGIFTITYKSEKIRNNLVLKGYRLVINGVKKETYTILSTIKI